MKDLERELRREIDGSCVDIHMLAKDWAGYSIDAYTGELLDSALDISKALANFTDTRDRILGIVRDGAPGTTPDARKYSEGRWTCHKCGRSRRVTTIGDSDLCQDCATDTTSISKELTDA